MEERTLFVINAKNGYIIQQGIDNYIAKTEEELYVILGKLLIKEHIDEDNLHVVFNIKTDNYEK